MPISPSEPYRRAAAAAEAASNDRAYSGVPFHIPKVALIKTASDSAVTRLSQAESPSCDERTRFYIRRLMERSVPNAGQQLRRRPSAIPTFR